MNIVEKINLFNHSKAFVKTGRVVIDLTETETPYEYVAFNKDNEDGKFYWIARYDLNKSPSNIYDQPDNGFKTANGCKRNFLKHANLIKEKF